MAGNLLEIIRRRQLLTYESEELRAAVSKTVAIESSRGWRLGKAKQSDRVDPVIALAMAALACVQAGAPQHMEFIRVPQAVPRAALSTGGVSGSGWGDRHSDAADDAAADARRAGAFMRSRRSKWSAY